MSDDPFDPPEEAKATEAPSKVVKTYAPGELPSIGDLFNDTIEDFGDNIGPYLMAGLGYMLVTMVVVMIAIFVLYGGMFAFLFGGIAAGAVIGGDAGGLVASLITVGGMFATFMLFFGVIAGVIMPVHASTERAVQAHIRGEQELGFGGPFSTVLVDLPSVIGVSLLLTAATMMGLCVFYIGALFAGLLLFWGGSLVALDRKGPIEALTTSVTTITSDFNGAGVHTLVCFLITMVAANIPIIGPMFAIALKVRMHDAIFAEA